MRQTLLSKIFQAYVTIGDLDAARSMVDGTAAGPRDREQALSVIAARQAEGGNLTAAKQTANSFGNDVGKGSARWCVAFALARAGDVQGALSVLGEAGAGERELIDAKAELAGSLARWGEPTSAADLRAAFAVAVTLGNEQKKNLVLREIMMEELAAGRLSEAMRAADASDDPIAMKFGVALERPEALLLSEKALKTKIVTEGSAAFLAKVEGAPEFPTSPELQALALHVRLLGMVAAGDAREALNRAKAVADAQQRDAAIGAVAEAQTLMGDLASAKETVGAIQSYEARRPPLRRLARAYAAAGNLAQARAAAQSIVNDEAETAPDWQGAALSEVAVAQARAGNLLGAIDTAGAIGSMTGSHLALQDIAQALILAGNRTGAREAAEALPPEQRVRALAGLAQAHVAAGEDVAAREAAIEARRLYEQLPEAPGKSLLIDPVAEALARASEKVRAAELVQALPDVIARGHAEVAVATGIAQRNLEPVERLREAAAGGDPLAQHQLALAYLEGSGAAHSEWQALAWLQRAAAGGSADALGMLMHLSLTKPGAKAVLESLRASGAALDEQAGREVAHELRLASRAENERVPATVADRGAGPSTRNAELESDIARAKSELSAVEREIARTQARIAAKEEFDRNREEIARLQAEIDKRRRETAERPGEGAAAAGSVPVAEVTPDFEVLTDEQKAGLRATDPASLRQSARNEFGVIKNGFEWDRQSCVSVCFWEACLNRSEPTPAGDYLDLALAYLMHGRFDSAIAVLEQGQRACPAGDPMSKYFGVFADDARNVKASLTAARDALREQGVSTTYPDERIFFAALAAADPKDDFLVLNLADAFAGAMPKSVTAWRCVADMNLGYWERHNIGESRVPQMRAKVVLIRGRQALEKMWRLDNKASYPAMRMMQHVLLTTSPPDPRRAVSRDEVPGLFGMADPNSIYTGRELAFLNFGKAVFYVKAGGGWEVSMMDQIIS